MKIVFLEEPELEFGTGRHLDIRFGIMNHAPLDFESPVAPKRINVGLVGTNDTIEGIRTWLERCREPIDAKESNQPHLFPRFPGYSEQTAFRSSLVFEEQLSRPLSKKEVAGLATMSNVGNRVTKLVELFLEEIKYLAQNTPAKVIVCAPPLSAIQAINADAAEGEPLPGEELDADQEEEAGVEYPDFHDLLKARSMQLYGRPIQIVLPSTYDESMRIKQTRAGLRRTLQDEATRAWNIHTALYYKAEGVPWRMARESAALTVCYIGVSFYRSLSGDALLTSVAQVFNERGEGVVVQGGAASISKEDRQPHLSATDAHQLLLKALKNYRDVHHTFPARVVIHKSSVFSPEELNGFRSALAEQRIDSFDFVSLTDSDTRLYRAGIYPPVRGTLLIADEKEMTLYTRGSVPFFETYPGKYVPVPLRVRCDEIEQTQRFIAAEILSLTKMNWNNTQFDGSEPVTLRAARQCSSVLRYCVEGVPIQPRYSFYM